MSYATIISTWMKVQLEAYEHMGEGLSPESISVGKKYFTGRQLFCVTGSYAPKILM